MPFMLSTYSSMWKRQNTPAEEPEEDLFPRAPPPMYAPNSRQSQHSQVVPRTSITAHIPYNYHPAIFYPSSRWKRTALRPVLWWRCLKKNQEVLYSGWPVEFGGRSRDSIGNVEQNTRTSLQSSQMIGWSDFNWDAHPLATQYSERVDQVSTIISHYSAPTRTILVWMEMITVLWGWFFFAGLIAQGSFLRGVAISLIGVIVFNAAAVNKIRLNRWAMGRDLTVLTRQWSPPGLYTSVQVNLGEEGLSDLRKHAQIRWHTLDREGAWGLTFRPDIRVELITPTLSLAPSRPITETRNDNIPTYEQHQKDSLLPDYHK